MSLPPSGKAPDTLVESDTIARREREKREEGGSVSFLLKLGEVGGVEVGGGEREEVWCSFSSSSFM